LIAARCSATAATHALIVVCLAHSWTAGKNDGRLFRQGFALGLNLKISILDQFGIYMWDQSPDAQDGQNQ
jgi:hypothetical protein